MTYDELDIFEPSAIDFYNWDELDKLREKRAKKFCKIWKKIKSGDDKAKAALKKHMTEDKTLKKKAEIIGYCWD